MSTTQWIKKHKKQLLAYSRGYATKNRALINQKIREKRYLLPGWEKSLLSIKGKMYNPHYIKKHIKNNITLEELKALWFRDEAEKMKWPVLHRINDNRNYEFNNCKYMEHGEHTRFHRNNNNIGL